MYRGLVWKCRGIEEKHSSVGEKASAKFHTWVLGGNYIEISIINTGEQYTVYQLLV